MGKKKRNANNLFDPFFDPSEWEEVDTTTQSSDAPKGDWAGVTFTRESLVEETQKADKRTATQHAHPSKPTKSREDHDHAMPLKSTFPIPSEAQSVDITDISAVKSLLTSFKGRDRDVTVDVIPGNTATTSPTPTLPSTDDTAPAPASSDPSHESNSMMSDAPSATTSETAPTITSHLLDTAASTSHTTSPAPAAPASLSDMLWGASLDDMTAEEFFLRVRLESRSLAHGQAAATHESTDVACGASREDDETVAEVQSDANAIDTSTNTAVHAAEETSRKRKVPLADAQSGDAAVMAAVVAGDAGVDDRSMHLGAPDTNDDIDDDDDMYYMDEDEDDDAYWDDVARGLLRSAAPHRIPITEQHPPQSMLSQKKLSELIYEYINCCRPLPSLAYVRPYVGDYADAETNLATISADAERLHDGYVKLRDELYKAGAAMAKEDAKTTDIDANQQKIYSSETATAVVSTTAGTSATTTTTTVPPHVATAFPASFINHPASTSPAPRPRLSAPALAYYAQRAPTVAEVLSGTGPSQQQAPPLEVIALLLAQSGTGGEEVEVDGEADKCRLSVFSAGVESVGAVKVPSLVGVPSFAVNGGFVTPAHQKQPNANASVPDVEVSTDAATEDATAVSADADADVVDLAEGATAEPVAAISDVVADDVADDIVDTYTSTSALASTSASASASPIINLAAHVKSPAVVAAALGALAPLALVNVAHPGAHTSVIRILGGDFTDFFKKSKKMLSMTDDEFRVCPLPPLLHVLVQMDQTACVRLLALLVDVVTGALEEAAEALGNQVFGLDGGDVGESAANGVVDPGVGASTVVSSADGTMSDADMLSTSSNSNDNSSAATLPPIPSVLFHREDAAVSADLNKPLGPIPALATDISSAIVKVSDTRSGEEMGGAVSGVNVHVLPVLSPLLFQWLYSLIIAVQAPVDADLAAELNVLSRSLVCLRWMADARAADMLDREQTDGSASDDDVARREHAITMRYLLAEMTRNQCQVLLSLIKVRTKQGYM